ncbi:MAG: hypothetical protein NTU98_00595 [Bacteroidetes bacterium]|nr:hypothetical protein [Bacteroidota bacterium]
MKIFLDKTESSTESTYSIGEKSAAVVSKENANDTFTGFRSNVVNEQMKETNNEDPRMLLLNAMHQYECKLMREFTE